MNKPRQVSLPQALRIRRYQAPDHDDVWHLHLEVGRQTRLEHPDAVNRYEDDLHSIEATYLSDGSNFWVIEATDGLSRWRRSPASTRRRAVCG